MAGVEISVTVDDRDLVTKARRLLDRLGDLSAPMAEIAEVMLNATHDRFESETDPDGRRWPRLAPATVAGRLKRCGNAGLTILRDSGRLVGSLHPRSGLTWAAVGTNVVHGAIHQFGGQAGRGHKATIPARAYLGLGERKRGEIEQVLDGWLAGR